MDEIRKPAERPDAPGEANQRAKNLFVYKIITEGGDFQAKNGNWYRNQPKNRNLKI